MNFRLTNLSLEELEKSMKKSRVKSSLLIGKCCISVML